MAAQVALAVGSSILSDSLRDQTPFQLKAPEKEPIKELITPVEAPETDVLLGTNKKKNQKEKNTVYNLRRSQSVLGINGRGIL
jgi:hypothetical protein